MRARGGDWQPKSRLSNRGHRGNRCSGACGKEHLRIGANDESRETYRVPVLVEEMVRRGGWGTRQDKDSYKRVKGAASEKF